MPILEKGNMFDIWGHTDLFLFTSNHMVRKDNKAVMGAGCAKLVKEACPGIDDDFGRMLISFGDSIDPVGIIGNYKGQQVGYFMTKYDWKNNSSIPLIENGVKLLRHYSFVNMNRIDMFFPGTTNGKLDRADILDIIKHLPENVRVWER